MIFGLNAGLSGLRANARRLEVTANNLANVNTPSFKKLSPIQQELGKNLGVKVSLTKTDTTPGSPMYTGNPLDVAINGDGYFRVLTPNGKTGFSRNGNFVLDNQGRLADASGNLIQPEVKIPVNASSVSVKGDGSITAKVSGTEQLIGKIEINRFTNPGGLMADGGGVSLKTSESGPPLSGSAGAPGFGFLYSGSLESSNVDIVQEITGMLLTKHAFSANIKTIRAADEMLGETLNIKA